MSEDVIDRLNVAIREHEDPTVAHASAIHPCRRSLAAMDATTALAPTEIPLAPTEIPLAPTEIPLAPTREDHSLRDTS